MLHGKFRQQGLNLFQSLLNPKNPFVTNRKKVIFMWENIIKLVVVVVVEEVARAVVEKIRED